MISARQARHEEWRMFPDPPRDADTPPEHACTVMATQLDALEHDIRAARPGAPGRRALRRLRRPDGEHVRLDRRRAIVIRPVGPADAGALRSLFDRLGALTRYRRFLAPLEHLSAHQITFLTQIDEVEHDALLAFDALTGQSVGVARYHRRGTQRQEARLAVVVADAWQAHGVATALVERLGARARANGIEVFRGVTVGANPAARALLQHAARTLAADWNMGWTELSASIADAPPAPVPVLVQAVA